LSRLAAEANRVDSDYRRVLLRMEGSSAGVATAFA
jgi:ABC-type uncharacterized transport system fused permease/ATPase subunit